MHSISIFSIFKHIHASITLSPFNVCGVDHFWISYILVCSTLSLTLPLPHVPVGPLHQLVHQNTKVGLFCGKTLQSCTVHRTVKVFQSSKIATVTQTSWYHYSFTSHPNGWQVVSYICSHKCPRTDWQKCGCQIWTKWPLWSPPNIHS